MVINSIEDIWTAACEEIKNIVTGVGFELWFKDLHPIELRSGELVLGIDSITKKDIIEVTYKEIIEESLKKIMGIEMKINLVVEDEKGHIMPAAVKLDPSFEESFSFDNFIVGSTNRFAHAAALAVADNPSCVYNPLVIYGNSGVGKTHLLLAIKNHINQKFPEKNVFYARCEDFTNQLIKALHEGQIGVGVPIDEFRHKFRDVDVLLMDDIQFIAGKESTQEEFFNTFNALHQNNKQIIVTMDRPPKDIKTLDDRIRNRFESGLIADISSPDFETRVGIINTKANLLNITLEENIVYYIAEHIKVNTRQLEGVVKKLQAYINIQNKTPTIAVVQGFIKEVVIDTQPEPIKVERIISEVSRTYAVDESDILSKKRTSQLSFARHVAMYIARETTELSYKAIGDSFGKNHATVLVSVQNMEEYLRTNPYEKEIIDDIIKNIKNE